MADYREISQSYAQGGFRALALANGGASVAVLSQFAELNELGLKSATAWSLYCWVSGIIFALLCWIAGFSSTRYVDRSERAGNAAESRAEMKISDRHMNIGVCLFFLSTIAFGAGFIVLAYTYMSIP